MVSESNPVVVQDGQRFKRLFPDFDSLVPCVDSIYSSGQRTIGNACRPLVKHLFSIADLKAGGINKLDTEKVAALLGCSFSFLSFFVALNLSGLDFFLLRVFLSQVCSNAKAGKID